MEYECEKFEVAALIIGKDDLVYDVDYTVTGNNISVTDLWVRIFIIPAPLLVKATIFACGCGGEKIITIVPEQRVDFPATIQF